MSKVHFKYRFIENGPVVICIANFWFSDKVSKRRLGGQVKAMAKVNEAEGDVFNIQVGRDLSKAKANKKAYDRILKTESRRLKYFSTIKDTIEEQMKQFEIDSSYAEDDLDKLKNSL